MEALVMKVFLRINFKVSIAESSKFVSQARLGDPITTVPLSRVFLATLSFPSHFHQDSFAPKRITSIVMDPLNPKSFNHVYTTVNGLQYHYIDQTPPKSTAKPSIVLVHGFPDVPLIPTFLDISSGMAGVTKFVLSSKQVIVSLFPRHQGTAKLNHLVPSNIIPSSESRRTWSPLFHLSVFPKPFTSAMIGAV